MIIQKGQWQAPAIHDLVTLLEPDEAVQALLLKGSLSNPQIQADSWSDVDVTIVVADGFLHTFFPTIAWLAPLGELYTFSQSSDERTRTTRACFADFRRLDCVFVQECDFSIQAIHSEAVQPLFSRSPLVDGILAKATLTVPPVATVTSEQFEQMVNAFWFKGMLTTSKVMRNDLLIATHLALELVQDTCVLAMMLRDREKGTSHHREGGMGNALIAQLDAERHPYTPIGLLESVKQSSILFDTLAAQWSADYQARRHPLLAWISYALETLAL
jgi:Streptomycin adenylyltransferase